MAAEILNTSEKTMRRLVKQKYFHVNRVGKMIRISEKDLKLMLKRTRV